MLRIETLKVMKMKNSEAILLVSKIISTDNSNFDNLSSIEWEKVISAANWNLLTPALYISLKRKDMLHFIEDKELVNSIAEIYELNLSA